MKPFVFTLISGEDLEKIEQGLEAGSCYDVEINRGATLDGFVVDTPDSGIRFSERLLL